MPRALGPASPRSASRALRPLNQEAGEVRFLIAEAFPDTWDPYQHTIQAQRRIEEQIFDTLWRIETADVGQFSPGLAESWTQIDDVTVECKLRQGVTFHNGQPFTAADVKASIERASGATAEEVPPSPGEAEERNSSDFDLRSFRLGFNVDIDNGLSIKAFDDILEKFNKIIKKYEFICSDEYVSIVAKIIMENEGSYSSVNPNDNGALSIGALQWRAFRARNLLAKIINRNPELATLLKGTSLIDELKNKDFNWNTRTLDEFETLAVKKLLNTKESREIQQEILKEDIQRYIKVGRKYGINDPKALAYFCDLYNQGPKYALEIVKLAGGGDGLTLDKIHQIALSHPVMGDYVKRRRDTYNKIKERVYM